MSPDGPVVAVDGGGNKTDLALVDRDGGLVGLVRGGPSQAHDLGVEGCVEVLEDLLAKAATEIGPLERPFASAACILLAGADLPEEAAVLRGRIEQLNWGERLLVDNDTLALLRAGTDRGWGVAVVAGTGTNCLGLAPDGREVRFPSLGEITGDWGGGGQIGLAALAAASRSADGRGSPTVLENAVPEHFGLAEPQDVARALHLQEISARRLAELAPLVVAASDHDPVAAGIVRRVADEVIAFARAAINRLDLTAADPDVVLGGSILRALPSGTVEAIARAIHEVASRARVVVSPSEPIVGAALLGLDAVHAGAEASARARAELDAAVDRLALR